MLDSDANILEKFFEGSGNSIAVSGAQETVTSTEQFQKLACWEEELLSEVLMIISI